MKSLSKLEHLTEIISFLTKIEKTDFHVMVWQLDKETNKRKIHSAKLVEVGENDNLDFEQLEDNPFDFSAEQIYFYIENSQIIFKANQKRIADSFLSVNFPDQVMVLDENEYKDLQSSFVEMDEKFKASFPSYEDGELKEKGYDFDSIKAQKSNDYFELNSEREKIKTEYMAIDSEREKIEDQYETHDGEREKIEYEDMSGYVAAGSDQVGGTMGGSHTTENLSSSMSGKGSTEKFSTTEKAGYKGTEKYATTEKAGYKGTDQVSTKERVKNIEPKNTEQSDRDKAIFEEELSFVSLDEEDKFYADKRDAPRAKPKEGKTVIMRKKTDADDFEGNIHPLFDLSRGGLGAVALSETLYDKGEVVLIMGFDDNVLDQPMEAIVRSIRETDENTFKIGMQFYTEGM